MELGNYINQLGTDDLAKMIEAVSLDRFELDNYITKFTHYYQEFDSPYFMEHGSIARKLLYKYYNIEDIYNIAITIGGIYPVKFSIDGNTVEFIILDACFEFPIDQQPCDEFTILLDCNNANVDLIDQVNFLKSIA